MPRYKIFTKDELGPEIQVDRSYPAFKIIDVDESKADDLAQAYPMQELPDVEVPHVHENFRSLAAANDSRRGRRDVLVKLKYPAEREIIESIETLGVQIIGRDASTGLVAAVPNNRVHSRLLNNEHVASVTPHRAKININPTFFQNLVEADIPSDIESAMEIRDALPEKQRSRDLSVPGLLVLEFYTPEDAARGLRRLDRELSGDAEKITDKRILVDLGSSEDVESDALAVFTCVGVKRLSEKKIKQLYNDRARHVIAAGIVTEAPHNNRLTGAGEIVAVADSGLDTGDAATLHPDFRGRIVDIESWPIAPSLNSFVVNPGGDDGASDEFSGHGTHVAGSVLGNGSRAASLGLPLIEGVAPEAGLVFQAIEQRPQWTQQQLFQFLVGGQEPPTSGLFGIPDDLKDLFRSARDSGAHIHNNSWGGGTPGAYDEQCEDLDEFVWNNKDFLVLVAAGNSGADMQTPHGYIDPISVDSPGTAKNCLTVGACENERSEEFTDKYSEWWPQSFPHQPISDDLMADQNDDIVAFSSRGPTLTGRRKPDLVAPGTFVLSTRSSVMPPNNFAWGAFNPAKKDYMFMGGTSMASPLAAGAAALWRQYLRSEHGIEKPSAALLKAGLIHSAEFMPYKYAAPDSGPPADNEQGWGRISLANVIDLDDPSSVFAHDEEDGLWTGEDRTFTIAIGEQSDLRVTLAYSDFPGELLVNNLNLLVFDPDGNPFIGNDFEGDGRFDDLNNVEGVLIRDAQPGTWSVSVIASDIMNGPQDFALVIKASSNFKVN